MRSWLTLDDCHSPRVTARYWPKCGSWMKRDRDDASLFGAGGYPRQRPEAQGVVAGLAPEACLPQCGPLDNYRFQGAFS
jgi:hypothetical protein